MTDPLIGPCPAELPLGGGWPCILDVGHESDHEYRDHDDRPTIRITWSREFDREAGR